MTELELLTAAHNLPEDIREQLSSVRTMSFMIDLNSRLNIKGERQRIIPGLVLRLVARDLNPQDFLSELAIQLNISDSSAKIITKEIEEKIFHPIEDSLRDKAEVDVALLHFGKEVSGELPKVTDAGSAPAATPIQAEKPKPIVETEQHIEAKIAAPAVKPAVPSGPFMLHKEKEEIKPVETRTPRPAFSIKIPITQKKYYSAPAPVKARIETPENGEVSAKPASPGAELRIENGAVKIAQPKIQKVVHYSNFFTKL